MSSRPRRKSTAVRKSLAEDSEHDDESDDDSEKGKQRNKRMNAEDEEMFIKKCIEKFNEINNKGTIRGTPTSPNAKAAREMHDKAWNEITQCMNEKTYVSKYR